jgi:hypothetical protein
MDKALEQCLQQMIGCLFARQTAEMEARGEAHQENVDSCSIYTLDEYCNYRKS